MGFLIVAILIGLLPAVIASSKGYSFMLWWLYGAALFIVALPHSLMLGPGGTKRKCPFCAETIRTEASVCPHCQRDLPVKTCQCGAVIPDDAVICRTCAVAGL